MRDFDAETMLGSDEDPYQGLGMAFSLSSNQSDCEHVHS